MKIKDFEKKIQKEIDPNLSIRPNTNTTDIAGVYIGEGYLGIAVPQNEIMPQKSEFFMDKNGAPFRGVKEAMRDIKAKLSQIDQKKYELLTEKQSIPEHQDDIIEVEDDDDDMIIT